MAYEVTEDLAAHYDGIRQQRGWSWEVLADYFAQQHTDPTSANLARWAREQAAGQPAARAAKKGTERAVKAPAKKA